MADNALRGSLFGGFKRSDVVQYIEATASQYNERTNALLKANEDLTKENESLSGEIERLREELEHTKAEIERITPLLEQAQSEAEALREEVVPLRREKDDLQTEANTLRAQAEEFASTKLHITEIELNARQNADRMINEAQSKVADSVAACREKCNAILEALDTTCANAEITFRQSGESVSALPEAFRALRQQLDEL